MLYQIPKLFPTENAKNLVIGVCGIGSTKDFSALMTNIMPDIQLQFNGQFFPLYYYEEGEEQPDLFSEPSSGGGLVRREAITGEALGMFRRQYEDHSITKEDVFYYVYGILHSPEYKTRWAADLKKSLPRIPFARDFRAFSKAGRELAKWHLNYETVEPYPVTLEVRVPGGSRRVEKMRFAKTNGETDKTGIVYNDNITLRGIPEEAYDYKVNGKSAVEWIMERYCDSTDPASGIRNDANEWAPEDPEYILNLLRRVIKVSVQSARIVAALPTLGI